MCTAKSRGEQEVNQIGWKIMSAIDQSLSRVTSHPGLGILSCAGVNVLIGANGAGKSNLSDSSSLNRLIGQKLQLTVAVDGGLGDILFMGQR